VSQGAACFSDHANGDFLEHVFWDVMDVDFFGLCVGAYVRESFCVFQKSVVEVISIVVLSTMVPVVFLQ
jgi:hypothetical protein